jgi:hypothetical protein
MKVSQGLRRKWEYGERKREGYIEKVQQIYVISQYDTADTRNLRLVKNAIQQRRKGNGENASGDPQTREKAVQPVAE